MPLLAVNMLMFCEKSVPTDFMFIIPLEVNFSGTEKYKILSFGIE
jgi:hypothetical protein